MKSELDSIKDWYVYNSNFRKKFVPIIFEKVSEEERFKDKGASFYSLVGIFMHVLDAYREWLLIGEERLSEYKGLDVRKRYTRTEVEVEERKVDSYIASFIQKLTPEDLDRKITWTQDGQTLTIEVRGILLHMIEDELQHRGELNALLWQMDIRPPNWAPDDWTPKPPF